MIRLGKVKFKFKTSKHATNSNLNTQNVKDFKASAEFVTKSDQKFGIDPRNEKIWSSELQDFEYRKNLPGSRAKKQQQWYSVSSPNVQGETYKKRDYKSFDKLSDRKMNLYKSTNHERYRNYQTTGHNQIMENVQKIKDFNLQKFGTTEYGRSPSNALLDSMSNEEKLKIYQKYQDNLVLDENDLNWLSDIDFCIKYKITEAALRVLNFSEDKLMPNIFLLKMNKECGVGLEEEEQEQSKLVSDSSPDGQIKDYTNFDENFTVDYVVKTGILPHRVVFKEDDKFNFTKMKPVKLKQKKHVSSLQNDISFNVMADVLRKRQFDKKEGSEKVDLAQEIKDGISKHGQKSKNKRQIHASQKFVPLLSENEVKSIKEKERKKRTSKMRENLMK